MLWDMNHSKRGGEPLQRGSSVMQDTFQVQFVVNDDASGMVDNNKNSDFELPLLSAPTEDEVTESRAERIKSWESRIRQVSSQTCKIDGYAWTQHHKHCKCQPVRIPSVPSSIHPSIHNG